MQTEPCSAHTRVGAALGQAQDESQHVELHSVLHPGEQAGHQAPGDEEAAQEARRAKEGAQPGGWQLQHHVAQVEEACRCALPVKRGHGRHGTLTTACSNANLSPGHTRCARSPDRR
jgi:hypothetical protein